MNYVLCTKETEETHIPTGKIAPCHRCGVHLKISKPTLDRLKRLKETPSPICKECFEAIRDIRKSLRFAPPSKNEIKALRKVIPNFNQDHINFVEDEAKK